MYMNQINSKTELVSEWATIEHSQVCLRASHNPLMIGPDA